MSVIYSRTLSILSKSVESLKAREISERLRVVYCLNADRHAVNSILYGGLKDRCAVDSEFKWRVNHREVISAPMQTVARTFVQRAGPHFHYIAPLPNMKVIALFGILSYNLADALFDGHPEWKQQLGLRNIADPYVQHRRAHRILECGLSLHEFVPLYIRTHTPMQYVVTNADYDAQAENVVFAEVDTAGVFQIPGVNYTDGNAASVHTRIYNDDRGLQHVDWSVNPAEQLCQEEVLRRRAVEVLVPKKVKRDLITGFVCMTDKAAEDLRTWIRTQNPEVIGELPKYQVRVDRSHFYRRYGCCLVREDPDA